VVVRATGEVEAMRTDRDILLDLEEELHWDPGLRSGDIAVAVMDGVVTLAGFARTYREKARAAEVARCVEGVAGVANDIEVKLPLLKRRPDPEIARDAVATIRELLPDYSEKIQVLVHDGRMTLTGEVDSHSQKVRVEEAVSHVRGLRALANDIKVKLQNIPVELKQRIEQAFLLNAEIEADQIAIDVGDDGTIVLSGSVSSWTERDYAERTAREAPGVRRVDNRIDVRI
jgi:osmotically-inducible protein OsmY